MCLTNLKMEVSENDVREVIHTYFTEHSFVKQQMDSCNRFYDENMQKTIDDLREIVIKSSDEETIYKIRFHQISLKKPEVTEPDGEIRRLYPRDARLRNLSYSGSLYCDITITSRTNEEKEHNEIYIGKVPIMVKSKFCNLIGIGREELCRLGEDPNDIGGYFIVNGIERVVIGQERMRNNHVFVTKTNPDRNEYMAEMRSTTVCQSRPPSIVKVHMMPARGDPSKMSIRATLPYIRTKIPVAIIFRGLGVHSEEEIMGCIGIDRYDVAMAELIRPSLDEARVIKGKQDALDYIGRRGEHGVQEKSMRIKFAKDKLESMLPHAIDVHIEDPDVSIACNFGYIIYRLLQCALLRRREDDKNHYVNRRIDLSGSLLNDLFRKLFIGLKQDMRAYAEKIVVKRRKELDPNLAISAGIITQGFRHALASGNWDDTTFGVSQVLNRLTYVATFSHLRRLNSTFGYLGSQTKPRQVHNSQWGRICPAETPEGQACGLVKNMALMAHVTVGSFENQISKLLDESTDVFKFLERSGETAVKARTNDKVFLNGSLLGFHPNGKQLVSEIRLRRRKAAITSEVGVVMDFKNREVRICTDYGRCTRPLLVVENLKILMKKEDVQELKQDGSKGKWDKLVRKGYLEYIDADEEETTGISMTIKDLRSRSENPDESNVDWCTHCELHPSLILGISASMIPFPEHNQAYRNTIQASTNKQAIGTYASNFHYRMDPSAHVLYYPQKPLVKTWMTQQLQSRQPAGINAIVAVDCYSGFNQGDSIIMNQSSIDRGLFRSMLFRSHRDEMRRTGTLSKEEFCCPSRHDTMGMRRSCNYTNIDSDGLVHPGTIVCEDGVLIGKTARIEQESASQAHYTREDRSTYLRPYQKGTVDQVLITTNGDGLPLAKVRVRCVRAPEIGDKFSSRHGQKGLIGMTFTQENLPWTVEGITPDVIINPHSIPSRMTIGQFMESILGKVAARKGQVRDATPFTDVTVENIQEALHKCGYQKSGMETMCCGETGRLLSDRICIGPTYYMKLAHMVKDKIHSRARGPVHTHTRQPTRGRLRGGGLRFGEMERDCLISHGSALNLKERLFELSDCYLVNVCESCGRIAQTKSYCKICNKRFSDVSQARVPYAWKLLCQELMAMGIAPRMALDKH